MRSSVQITHVRRITQYCVTNTYIKISVVIASMFMIPINTNDMFIKKKEKRETRKKEKDNFSMLPVSIHQGK